MQDEFAPLEPRPNYQQEVSTKANVLLALRKSPHQHRVETFMRQAGQDIPSQPTIPDAKIRELRIRLLLEEVFETAEALGVVIFLPGAEYDRSDHDPAVPVEFGEFQFITTDDVDLVAAVDGLADISVVNTGAFSALGVADVAVLEEVDRHNLGKFGTGSGKDSTGKWKKPPNYPPPDFKAIIEAQSGILPTEVPRNAKTVPLPSRSG